MYQSRECWRQTSTSIKEEIKMKKQMSYLEFFEQVAKNLRENKEWNLEDAKMRFFQSGYTGENTEDAAFVKETNRRYFDIESDSLRGDWLVIYSKSDNEGYEFPMNLLYQLYQREGMDMVWLQFRNKLNASTEQHVIDALKDLWDYEKKKDSLILRIQRYSPLDNDAVGFQHGDISVIVNALIYDDNANNTGTMTIRSNIADCWGQNDFDIISDAFINMIKSAPPTLEIESPDAIEINMLSACGNVEKYVNIDSPLVVSHERITEGAISIFYPSLQEILGSLLGNYYTLMYDSTKALVFPDTVSEDAVRELLCRKLQETPRELLLSEKVYFYDCDTAKFQVLDD